MNENDVSVSQWEWDNIVNDPKRQAAAEERAANERAEQESRLCAIRQRCAERKKAKLLFKVYMFLVGALAAGVIARYAGQGGIDWLAQMMVITAAVFGTIACLHFVQISKIGRK